MQDKKDYERLSKRGRELAESERLICQMKAHVIPASRKKMKYHEKRLKRLRKFFEER
jgi:hypothetical protein